MEIYGYGNIIINPMDWFEAYGEALDDCYKHGHDMAASMGARVRAYSSPATPETLLLIPMDALTWSRFWTTLLVIRDFIGGGAVDFSYKITEDSSGEEIGSGYLRRKSGPPRLDALNATLSIFGSGTNATNLTELTWL